MNVTLSPVNNNYSFKAKSVSKKEIPIQPTKRQITDAKIKKTVSECFCVALGVTTLYFFSKIQGKNIAQQKMTLKEMATIMLEPILPSGEHIEKARTVMLG